MILFIVNTRANFVEMLTQFGYEDQDIGQALIDITRSFSDEFYYFEVQPFFLTPYPTTSILMRCDYMILSC